MARKQLKLAWARFLRTKTALNLALMMLMFLVGIQIINIVFDFIEKF